MVTNTATGSETSGPRIVSQAPYQVADAKIVEFADAIGDPNPLYRDVAFARARGFAQVVAPPTFPVVVTMGLLRQFLAVENAPLNQVVHGAQGFTFHRPVAAGDILRGSLAVASRKQFGANEIVVTNTSIVDDAGKPVADASATVIFTALDQSVAGATEPSESATESKPSGSERDTKFSGAEPRITSLVQASNIDSEVAPLSAMEPLRQPPLASGARLAPLRVAISRADLVRYAGASGDFNPIHFSDHAANALGLPGVIAHGMLTMALAGRVLTSAVDDPARLSSFAVRFTNPIVVPDDGVGSVCEFTGSVAEHASSQGYAVTLGATCAGQAVLKQAKATVNA